MPGPSNDDPLSDEDARLPETARARARFVVGMLATALAALVGSIVFGQLLGTAGPLATGLLMASVSVLAVSLACYFTASEWSIPRRGDETVASWEHVERILGRIRSLTTWGRRLGLVALVTAVACVWATAAHDSQVLQVRAPDYSIAVEGVSVCLDGPLVGTATRGALSPRNSFVGVELASDWCDQAAGDTVFVPIESLVVAASDGHDR